MWILRLVSTQDKHKALERKELLMAMRKHFIGSEV